jgi:hypothetical protein
VVNAFVKDCTALMQALEVFKNQMKMIVPMKDQEVMYYKNFVDFLSKYEEVSEKQMGRGMPGQPPADPNVSTTLLYSTWGEDLKANLTKTVNISFINLF